MKNTQLLKAVILIISLGSLVTTDLNAGEGLRVFNDTTEVRFSPVNKQVNYTLMSSFLDEFTLAPQTEISPFLKETSMLKTPSVNTKKVASTKPEVNLKKFHKDDALNTMENSIQKHLKDYQNTQMIYRDYFKIPLNLNKK